MSGIEEGVLIGSAIIGAGAGVYSATQAGKGVPHPPKPPPDPLHPTEDPAGDALRQGDLMAKTAGGTLLSKPGQPAVGDAANAVRKTLLGT